MLIVKACSVGYFMLLSAIGLLFHQATRIKMGTYKDCCAATKTHLLYREQNHRLLDDRHDCFIGSAL